jgi:hypothetical protein
LPLGQRSAAAAWYTNDRWEIDMNESATTTSGQDGWLANLYRRRWVQRRALVLAIPTLLRSCSRSTRSADRPPNRIRRHRGAFQVRVDRRRARVGLFHWIFQALPQVCAETAGRSHVPRLIYEEGHDLPVGMSKRHHQGIDKTFLSTAPCHASTVRDAPNSKRVYLDAGDAARHHGLRELLFGCAKDLKFAAEFVVPEARRLAQAGAGSRPALTVTSSIRSRWR